MKIKHFAGYGYVNARVIAKDVSNGRTTLVVEVTGDHERGIVRRDDCNLIKQWLVDKFEEYSINVPSWKIYYEILEDYNNEGDRAVYTISYPGKE